MLLLLEIYNAITLRITELHNRNIGFKSLTEQIDTTTSGGKLIFHIFGALAEFERDISNSRMALKQSNFNGLHIWFS